MTANPRSLHTTLWSFLIPLAFEGLVDSGSSDCFLDSVFVARNELPTREITPLPISLIDGTVNMYVNCVVLLPIKLSCGYVCVSEFYVTKLKGTYPAVLGYSWLSYYNPTIDWAERTILIKSSSPSQLMSPSTPALGNTVVEGANPP